MKSLINQVSKKLKFLVKKKNLIFTDSCDEALLISTKHLLDKSKNKIIVTQDTGGWLSYPKIAKKLEVPIIYIKTNKGKIVLSELKKYKECILIMHSLPGYCFDENMKSIQKICKKNNIKLINDACGSIGTESAKIGDIICCSFGKWKPLSAGGGGFFASNNEFDKEISEKSSEKSIQNDYIKINAAIERLQERVGAWKKISSTVKKEKKEVVINKGNQGINVLLKFKNDDEKEKLINFCQDKNLEYTICPRFIRSNEKAVCVEIKKLDL